MRKLNSRLFGLSFSFLCGVPFFCAAGCATDTSVSETDELLGAESEEDLATSKFAFQLASKKSWEGEQSVGLFAPPETNILSSCRFTYYSESGLLRASASTGALARFGVVLQKGIHGFGWSYRCQQSQNGALLGDANEGVLVIVKSSLKPREVSLDHFGKGLHQMANPFTDKLVRWQLTSEDQLTVTKSIRLTALSHQDGSALPEAPQDAAPAVLVLSAK